MSFHPLNLSNSYHNLLTKLEQEPFAYAKEDPSIITKILQWKEGDLSIEEIIHKVDDLMQKRLQAYQLSKQEKERIHLLHKQLLGLKYRSGYLSLGQDPELGKRLFLQLSSLFSTYQACPLEEPLRKVCSCYPDFIEALLLRNEHLPPSQKDPWTHDFFQWMLQERDPSLFILLPQEASKLLSSSVSPISLQPINLRGALFLTSCLRIHGVFHRIQGDEAKKTSVYLPCKAQNSSAGVSLTIHEILQTKDLACTFEGVVNWDSRKLGSYGPNHSFIEPHFEGSLLEFLQEKELFCSLSSSDYQTRYPKAPSGWDYALVIKTTKEESAYLELLHKQPDSYQLFSIGICPNKGATAASLQIPFPSSLCQTSLFLPLSDVEADRFQQALTDLYHQGKQAPLPFHRFQENGGHYLQKLLDTTFQLPFSSKQELLEQVHQMWNDKQALLALLSHFLRLLHVLGGTIQEPQLESLDFSKSSTRAQVVSLLEKTYESTRFFHLSSLEKSWFSFAYKLTLKLPKWLQQWLTSFLWFLSRCFPLKVPKNTSSFEEFLTHPLGLQEWKQTSLQKIQECSDLLPIF